MIFVFRSSLLRVGVIVFALLNVATSGVIMVLISSLRLSGHSPQVVSIVSLAVGLGALIGSLIAGPIISRVSAGTIIISGITLIASSVIGVTIAPEGLGVVWVFAVALLFGPAVNATIGGLMMYLVPKEIIGRVLSVVTFAVTALTPLAPFITGMGLDTIGYHRTTAVFSALAVLALLVGVTNQQIRRLPNAQNWNTVTL